MAPNHPSTTNAQAALDPVPGFRPISFAQDLAERVGPALLTQLLRDAVPVLGWVDWRLDEIEEGKATSLLPLNDESTNQHGTHQAALIALAADYTGGAALLTLVRGEPAVGVHPQLDDEGCAMWLVKLETSYQLPSAMPLTASAVIPEDAWSRIRSRYLAGKTVLLDVDVHFSSDGETVATGKCRYFLKRNSKLEPADLASKPNPIFALKSKASARLIAGLRAAETCELSPRVADPWAEHVAGPHGAFLARRFSKTMPPLRDMVVARTLDVDRLVEDCLARGVRQLVLVGVGLDMRPFRLLSQVPDAAVFELDLPHMLEERARLIERSPLAVPTVHRTSVPFNLRQGSIPTALAATTFRPNAPAVYVIEGVSMYQSEPVMRRLLEDLRRLLEHPESVAWLDVVKESVVRGSGVEAIDAFLGAMQKLGEPFTFGVDEPAAWLAGSGLRARELVSAKTFARASASADLANREIFDFYDFLHVVRDMSCGTCRAGVGADPREGPR